VPDAPRTSRPVRRRLVATAITIVSVSAALVAVYVARGRATPRTPSTAVAFAVPSSTADPAPAGTATAAPPECGSDRPGPLRSDTSFPADDGRGTPVNYSISLPEDYYSACKRYPVVYALHGKMQNNVTFMNEALSLRTAMAAGVLDQAIIVTPDSYSTGRWENRETGPAEDNLIKYLIPHVEEKYRVIPGASSRLLVGFSMGGHGAIRFGLKYPRMFAAVWSVDGAMAGSDLYLPFVEGKRSDDRIIAVGGKANGERVQRLVRDLGRHGVTVPYVYQDLEHEFVDFVEEDGRTGWHAMKYLQYHLGRPV
jgi:S-formylglutathione hydrolase FrmB